MSSETSAGLFDPGLQPERTLLAWRRATLSVGVVGAIGIRVTAGELGWTAVVLGSVTVVLSLLAYLAASWRYQVVYEQLVHTQHHPGDGWPQLSLTCTALLCGATASIWVLLKATNYEV